MTARLVAWIVAGDRPDRRNLRALAAIAAPVLAALALERLA